MKATIAVYGCEPGDAWLIGPLRRIASERRARVVAEDDAVSMSVDVRPGEEAYAERLVSEAFDRLLEAVEEYAVEHRLGLPFDEAGDLTRALEISLVLDHRPGRNEFGLAVSGTSWSLRDFWASRGEYGGER